MIMPTITEIITVAIFVAIHLFSYRVRRFGYLPRSVWLSAGGGVSIAYVFVDLLPEIAESEAVVADSGGEDGRIVWFAVFAGLSAFYVLDCLARKKAAKDGSVFRNPRSAHYWVHLLAFVLYNLMVGALLIHTDRESKVEAVLFAVAMGLHLLVVDKSLNEDFREKWKSAGRWVVSAAVIVGCLASSALSLDGLFSQACFAFLGGGVILNSMKEELPQAKDSRLVAFVIAGFGFAALLHFA